jgi:hypothetical protein
MGDEVHYYSVEGSRSSNIINIPSMSNVDSLGKFVFRVDLEEIEPAPTPGSLYHTYLYNCVITEYESNNHSIHNKRKQFFGLQ